MQRTAGTAQLAVSSSQNVVAPVGGWNARDAESEMDSRDAIELDNWYPWTSYVELRPGYSTHSTGVGTGAVETLASYVYGDTKKLLAFGSGEIYDATDTGAVGAALADGFSSNRWQTVNFGGYLLMVNGQDQPQKYDGTTVSSNTWTGTGLSSDDSLFGIHVFKNRLFLWQQDSQDFWYGAIDEITGTLTKFPLGGVAQLGGNIVAMGSWTRDAGDGADDVAVFMLSSGQVMIYQGTDPGDPDAWALIGIFNMGPLLGVRSLTKLGADLLLATVDGYTTISKIQTMDRNQNNYLVSDKISGEVVKVTNLYKQNWGWQTLYYPQKSMLIVNVPISTNVQYVQHVLNVKTGAWCRFTDIDMRCMAMHDNKMYFGSGSGYVFEFGNSTSDNGNNINASMRTAYKYFGGRGSNKHYKMVRPVFSANGVLPVSLALSVDDNQQTASYISSGVTSSGAEWDVALWDDAEWGDDVTRRASWQSVTGVGQSASLNMRVSTRAQTVRVFSFDYLYEKAGVL